MTGPPAGVLSYQTPEAARQPSVVWAVLARIAYVLFGLLVPAGCFVAGSDMTPLTPDYQDPNLGAQIALLLDGRNGWPMYGVIAYAMGCMTVLVAWPRWTGRSLVARLGLYGGVPVSFYYAMVMGSALFKPGGAWAELDLILLAGGIVLAAGFPLAMALLLKWVMTRWGSRVVWGILGGVMGLILLCALALGVLAGPSAVIFSLVLFLAGAGPVFALTVYAGASIEAWRRVTNPEPWAVRIGLGSLWAGGFAVSVWTAVRNALDAYAALPPTPPNRCYVCTAAARGHRKIVGGHDVVLWRGRTMVVNRQMRVLKAGEVALMTVSPRVHRAVRWVYDLAGPVLARMMRWRLLADAAYLALKPVEWATLALLRKGMADADVHVNRLYREQPAPRRA